MSALTTRTLDGDGTRTLVLEGDVTESADFTHALDACGGGTHTRVVLDLSRVRRINSAGVREWIGFMRALSDRTTDIEIVHASPAIVRQLSMVKNTRGTARVSSIGLPYLCPRCDSECVIDCAVTGDDVTLPADAPHCPSCDAPMEFDDVIEAYLGFLRDDALAG